MAWQLEYLWYLRRRFEPLGVSAVFDQKTHELAVAAGRRLWDDIKKRLPVTTGQNWMCAYPEVVWREALEETGDSCPRSPEIHQPDETAEYEFYRTIEHEE